MFYGLKILTSLLCLCVISGYAEEETQSYSPDTVVEKGLFQKRRGRRGRRGERGHIGEIGSQGHQGVRGPRGPSGAQGSMGSTGPTGAQGAQGTMGPTGPQGSSGSAGAQGATGSVGSSIFGYASNILASGATPLPLGSPIPLANDLVDTSGTISFNPSTYTFTIGAIGTYQISYFLRVYYAGITTPFSYDTFAVNINGVPTGTTEIIPVSTPSSVAYPYLDSETRQIVVNLTSSSPGSSVFLTAQNNSGMAWLANPGSTQDVVAYLFIQQVSPNISPS